MMAVKMNEDSTDEEMIRIAFRVLDKKGSGRIQRKEFEILMTNIGDKLTTSEVRLLTSFTINTEDITRILFFQFRMLISEADKDGDGNLDYEEFVQLMSQ